MAVLVVFTTTRQSLADCSDVPKSAPVIFQIDTASSSAVLHITPVSDKVTSYSLVYGFDVGDERFGANINQGNSTGAITYTVNGLSGNTKYAFRAQALNICGSGPWGEWKAATTKAGNNVTKLPTSGPFNILPIVFLVSGAIIFLSFVF